MFGCSDRRNPSFGDLPPEQVALKGVMERLQGMSRQVARSDHQLTEMNENVTTSKRDMDKAMEVAAQQIVEVMGHVDSVKSSIQSVQSSIEARVVAIESRLNSVECCIENSRNNGLGELDEVTAILTEKLNMEVQRLSSSMQDILWRLSEAEVAFNEAQQLEHRIDYVETICRQTTLKLSKVTDLRDDRKGVHRQFSAWCTDADQETGDLRRNLLSETWLTCEARVEPDACLDGRLPTDRVMADMDPVRAAENTFSSAYGGSSASEVQRGWRRRRSKNRDRSCPDTFTHWCAELPCVATVPAFPIEVASGQSTGRPHEDTTLFGTAKRTS